MFFLIHRKRSKVERSAKPLSTIDENIEPNQLNYHHQSVFHIPNIMQDVSDFPAASTSSKDGSTPVGSIAANGPIIKHGMMVMMDGLNDSSLMNITDNSIDDQSVAIGNVSMQQAEVSRKSKRSHNKSDFYAPPDNYAGPPPDGGRAIVNTSLIKVATQNQQHNRGRSPLANVAANNNQNGSSVEIEAQQKRNMAVIAENGFHLYQKKNPQTYFGEGNIVKMVFNYKSELTHCFFLQTISISSRTS